MLFLRWSGLLMFLLLWEAVPRFGWADAQFLPPLTVVLQAIYRLGAEGSLYIHLMVSLWRVLLGLLLAITIALPLAFVLEVRFPAQAKQMDPLFRLLSHVNPFSLAPLFILLFGIGEAEKLAIITLVAIWPLLFHTITGIRAVDPVLVKTARSMKVSALFLVREVLFPAALPIIITGLRVGTQMAVFMLIAAEMLGAGAGLGWLVHNSAMLYQIPRMYAGGLLIILVGIFINKLILQFERDSLFWQEPVDVVTEKSVTKDSDRLSSILAPVLIGALAGILFFGSQEVIRVNSQGLRNIIQHSVPPQAADHSAHGGHTDHKPAPGMQPEAEHIPADAKTHHK